MIVIFWKSGPSEDYRDLLPPWWFEAEGTYPFREHETQTPRGGRFVAQCSLSVKGRIADLDYGGTHGAENQKRFPIGTLRLTFTDESRTEIQSLQWRDDGAAEFANVGDEAEAIELDLSADVISIFDPTNDEDDRRKIRKLATIRQHQQEFRQKVMDAYGGRCAITGCPVKEALEAAHIMPYLGDKSDNVTNGLLLRADIHTLFDKGLIKIDRAYQITASPHVMESYRLPGTITPPRNPALHPSPEAFHSKWKR